MSQPADLFARVRHVDETGSTNEDAAALLGDEAHAGLTIVARHQVRGTGRKGRSWIDRPGSALLCTTILPQAIAAKDLWVVPFWAALAVRRALSACSIASDVQWPNDVLIDGAKVAGILCVSRVAGYSAWVGCGVGINVTRPPRDAHGITPPPAYCDDVAPVRRDALLKMLLAAYEASFESLNDAETVARRWEAEAGLPGRRYTLLRDGESRPFEATAIAIAEGGGLVVKRDGGERETVALADARAPR